MKRMLQLASVLLLSIACSKNDDPNADSDINEVAVGINGMAEISYIGHSLLEGTRYEAVGCATVDSTAGLITLHFGTTDCVPPDGIARRGSISVRFTDSVISNGSLYMVTADDYRINGYIFNGDYKFTLLSTENNVQTVEGISDMIIRVPESNTNIIYASTETQKIAMGYKDGNPDNNEITIAGTSGGNTPTGLGFNTNITEDLVYRFDCSYITKGRLSISSDSFETRILTYGEGECDNKANEILDPIVRDITL